MKNLILLVVLFLSTIELNAQIASKVQMSPAEYQSLMETILKARAKKLLMLRQRQIVLQRQAEPIAQNNLELQEKLERLEKTYDHMLVNDREAISAQFKHELDQLNRDIKRDLSNLKDRNYNSNLGQKSVSKDLSNAEETERLKKRMLQLEKEFRAQNKKYANESSIRDLKKSQKKIVDKLQEVEKEVSTTSDSDAEIKALERKFLKLDEQMKLLGSLNSDENNSNVAIDNRAFLILTEELSALKIKINTLENLAHEKHAHKHPQLDSASTPDNAEEVEQLKKEIKLLKNQLSNHKHESPITQKVSSAQQSAIVPETNIDVQTFASRHRQQNVYYPNGSTVLSESEKNKIREVANWLNIYSRLEITIKGFASDVGSKALNQEISKNRAETVKNFLLEIGVKADRITLEPLGIDTISKDPANARRAEIHLYVK